jgi:hypothetical protein
MALNPVSFTEQVVSDFLRYQLTTYPLADENMYQRMRQRQHRVHPDRRPDRDQRRLRSAPRVSGRREARGPHDPPASVLRTAAPTRGHHQPTFLLSLAFP